MSIDKQEDLSFIIGMPCNIEGVYYEGRFKVTQFQTNLHSAVRAPEVGSKFYWNYFKVELKVPAYAGQILIPQYDPLVSYFSSLTSLVFGKKVKLIGITSQGRVEYLPVFDDVYEFHNVNAPINSSKPRVDFLVAMNIESFSIVDDFFDAILNSAKKKEIENYFRFLTMYSQALVVFESMPEVSFLSLICCSELFKQISRTGSDKSAERLVEDGEAILQNMREMNCDEDYIRKVQNRFSSISAALNEKIMSYLDDDFFTRTESLERQKRLTPENASEAIKRAYGLRSKYVHAGSDSGLGLMSSVAGGVVEVWGDLIRNGKEDKSVSASLSLVGLERVVRYCLLKRSKESFNLSV